MPDVQLLPGDCLEVMKSIPDSSIDMILADLPYGTTACKWDSVIPFPPLWEQYERVIRKNGAFVLTATQPFSSALVLSNPTAFRYEWIWHKVQATGPLNAKRQPLRACESVLVFYRAHPTYNPQLTVGRPISRTPGVAKPAQVWGGARRLERSSGTTRQPTTLITISQGRSPSSPTVHPTQKPVALMEYLIRTYTREGETVLDNTMGSGTTGVACVNTARNFIGIELDAAYFAIAEKRIADAQEMRRLDDQRPQLPLAA